MYNAIKSRMQKNVSVPAGSADLPRASLVLGEFSRRPQLGTQRRATSDHALLFSPQPLFLTRTARYTKLYASRNGADECAKPSRCVPRSRARARPKPKCSLGGARGCSSDARARSGDPFPSSHRTTVFAVLTDDDLSSAGSSFACAAGIPSAPSSPGEPNNVIRRTTRSPTRPVRSPRAAPAPPDAPVVSSRRSHSRAWRVAEPSRAVIAHPRTTAARLPGSAIPPSTFKTRASRTNPVSRRRRRRPA